MRWQGHGQGLPKNTQECDTDESRALGGPQSRRISKISSVLKKDTIWIIIKKQVYILASRDRERRQELNFLGDRERRRVNFDALPGAWGSEQRPLSVRFRRAT